MRLRLLFLLLVLAMSVPFATADTILNLTVNNLGITGSVGTVDLHQEAGGVLVTLTANSGFTFKVNGGDVFFNCPGCGLTAGSITGLEADGSSASFKNFKLKSPAPLGKFGYDIQNLKGSVGFANTISFTISGVTLSQLGNFGVHFACASTVPGCGPNGNTGFAVGGPTTVPEPGTLSLFGTGLVGLAGFFRRRFLS